MDNTSRPARGCEVRVDGLTMHHGASVALGGISLTVRAGEFMTFLGPSGGGKTTTLNLIAGFDQPTRGTVCIDGNDMNGIPPHRRDIGVVFQNYALFPHMTVGQNVAYPLVQRKIDKGERQRRVLRALSSVGLEGFEKRRPAQLSGGQQQRVALARAMVYRPQLLLMDEPLGALDRALREELQLEIRRIHREEGSTAIYVTHDQEEALVLSDRIAVFSKGAIQQVGTPRDLYDHPETLFVGKFLGESTVAVGAVGAHDRGAARVDGPFGQAWVPTTAAMRDEVAVLVRPEKQAVRPAPGTVGPGFNEIEARVIDCIFVGSTWKFRVQLLDGSVGVVRSTVTDTANIDAGQPCWVSWPVADGVALTTSSAEAVAVANDSTHDRESAAAV